MLRNRKLLLLLVVVLSGLLILSACGQPAAEEGETEGKGEGEAEPETEEPKEEPLEVSVALGADMRTTVPMSVIDWTTGAQIRNMFDAMLTRDRETMEIKPQLAKSFEVLDDLTWEFKLREGVKYHNGEEFTAEAVKFTVDYILNKDNESHYRARYQKITEVEIVDDYTVRIHTSEPFPILIDRLTGFYPMPPKYFEEVGRDGFAENPVGTGPFKFVERVTDQYTVLEKNPDYWQGEPEVDKVTFKYMPEFSSRLASLLAGEIDIIKDVPPRAVEKVNDSENSRVESTVSSRINYIALVNLKEGPMQNLKVRKAMNLAVNVPQLVETVMDGRASQMASSLSPMNSAYNPDIDPYGYDPDKAVELIKEAGYDPEELNLKLDTCSGRYPKDKQVAMAIADQLSKIGITVEVQVNEWGTHLDKIVNRETGDMFLLGWGPCLEPQGTIQPLFQGEWTYSGFTDEELETKIPEAVKIVDPEKRKKAFQELDALIWEKAPWIFLWQQHDLYGVGNNIEWSPRPDELLWLFEAKAREED